MSDLRLTRSSGEGITCFFCDYGHWLLVLLLIVGSLFIVFQNTNLQNSSTDPVTTPTPTVEVRTSPTSVIHTPVITATIAPTPVPLILTPELILPTSVQVSTPPVTAKPEYVIVIIPVTVTDKAKVFELARQQLDVFIKESNMEDYYSITVKEIPEVLETDLSSDELLNDIFDFGVIRIPADLYLGMTDGDIVADGESDVAGYTVFFSNVVVAEAGEDSTVAHEMGHIFGLCDEYDYEAWYYQNGSLFEGCPNPFPASCDKSLTNNSWCESLISEGIYSIMGGAFDWNYTHFSDSCLAALENQFKKLVGNNQ